MYLSRATLLEPPEPAPILDRAPSNWLPLLIAIHIPLGVLFARVSVLAAVHAGLTVAVALVIAIQGRSVARLAYAAAYITSAEVFWRMTNDRLPWELGKYAIILLTVVGILRLRGLRGLILPALGIALYLPSTVLTYMDLGPAETRNQLAFNLSGPLALALSAQFFAAVQLTPGEIRQLLFIMLAPVAGIATAVVHGIATAPEIVWTTESNYATSGGFGPNQVSGALGLGALAAFLCLCDARTSLILRATAAASMLWYAAQSVLTFSRGGIYCAVGGVLASSVFLIRNPQTRFKAMLAVFAIYAVGTTVIWPQLDRFTDGAITARYQDTETTGRADLSQEDFEIWRANPVLGVGPGRSRFFHSHGAATHTELTRLVSEHGVFGFTVLVLLAGAVARNLRRAASPREQGLVIAFMVWSLLFMVTAAMRTVAPAFVFGLAFAHFVPWSQITTRDLTPTRRMRPSTSEPAYA